MNYALNEHGEMQFNKLSEMHLSIYANRRRAFAN